MRSSLKSARTSRTTVPSVESPHRNPMVAENSQIAFSADGNRRRFRVVRGPAAA